MSVRKDWPSPASNRGFKTPFRDQAEVFPQTKPEPGEAENEMFSGAWVSACARVSLCLSACMYEPVHVNMSLPPTLMKYEIL